MVRFTIAMLAICTLTLAFTSRAAPEVKKKIVSDVSVPLNGTTFDVQTNETVTLAGHVHVQTTIDDFTAPYKIATKYKLDPDVRATGTSGSAYYFKDGKSIAYYLVGTHEPPSPMRVLSHSPVFRLYPRTTGNLPYPYRVRIKMSVQYDVVTGTVTGANAEILDPQPPNSCIDIVQVCN